MEFRNHTMGCHHLRLRLLHKPSHPTQHLIVSPSTHHPPLHTYIGKTQSPTRASSTAFLTSSSSPLLSIPCLGDLRLGLVLMAAIEWLAANNGPCMYPSHLYIRPLE